MSCGQNLNCMASKAVMLFMTQIHGLGKKTTHKSVLALQHRMIKSVIRDCGMLHHSFGQ